MRFCVIIPSESWRNTAGVRIRYNRLRPFLEEAGHSFETESIEAMMLRPIKAGSAGTSGFADVYLISKCHDIRSNLLVRQLRAAGCRVGIDVFDDYYSQSGDAAFVHLRDWFRDMSREVDFALCSTPNMRDRLRDLVPDLPCHLMNDPAGDWDAEALAAGLERNLARSLATRQIDIGWFGIGDNPYFPVGLEDLQAFAGRLARCRLAGFTPRLRILTNSRALTVERLAYVARLPIPARLDEWSEEAEARLIAESLFCFLPVNGQGFSTVKSLNRAISVLTGGAQVLSAGFPLYRTLDPFIYRNIDELLIDLAAGQLRLRRERLTDLATLMARQGSARHEAAALGAFLSNIPAPALQDWPGKRAVAVLHGIRSTGDIHKQSQKQGFFSVTTSVTNGNLNADIMPAFDALGQHADLTLSERVVRQLVKPWKDRAVALGEDAARPGFKPRYQLRISKEDIPPPFDANPPAPMGTMAHTLLYYRQEMARMRAILSIILDHPAFFLSDAASPYWAPELRPEQSETPHARH